MRYRGLRRIPNNPRHDPFGEQNCIRDVGLQRRGMLAAIHNWQDARAYTANASPLANEFIIDKQPPRHVAA